MTILYYIAITFFLFLCAILCCVILMQESKSTGLGTSFGGDAGTSIFGTSTADVLKQFTKWLAVIFFTMCILLSLWTTALGRARDPRPQYEIEEIAP